MQVPFGPWVYQDTKSGRRCSYYRLLTSAHIPDDCHAQERTDALTPTPQEHETHELQALRTNTMYSPLPTHLEFLRNPMTIERACAESLARTPSRAPAAPRSLRDREISRRRASRESSALSLRCAVSRITY